MPIESCTLPDGGGSGWRWGAHGTCYRDRADAEKQAAAAHANGFTGDRLALDRGSARTIDQDGHLHVAKSNISKANVCPYYGREIPNGENLGLVADRVYQLLRAPDELKQAADSFNQKPLLIQHKPQTADAHDHEIVVGSVGNVTWNDPFLQAELVVWDADAISAIQSGAQKELSCGYRYEADMTPGEYGGVKYDGVMRSILGNHVALVETGRAGSDVVVGDEAHPSQLETAQMANRAKGLSRQALVASGALQAYLMPKMALDQKIDLTKIVGGVTDKNWSTEKPAIKAGLATATRGKLAADADIGDVDKMLDKLDDLIHEVANGSEEDADKTAAPAEDEDPDDDDDDDEKDDKKKPAFLKGKDKSAKDKSAKDKAAKDASKDDEDMKAKDAVPKAAMDAAIAEAVKVAEANTIARLNAARAAERDVEPYIGKLAMAQDSAADIYKTALTHMKAEFDGITDPKALRAILLAHPKPGSDDPRPRNPRIAMDAAANKAYLERFPNANRLKH